MVITSEQLVEVVNDYIDTDILAHTSKMQNLEQLIFGIKVGVFKRSLPKIIDKYLNTPETQLLGVVTDKGIELDIIYESALENIRKIGSVEYGGIRFTEKDVKMIYDMAKKRGENNA